MAEIAYNNQSGIINFNLTAPSAGTSQTITGLFTVAPTFATLVSPNYVKLVLDNGTANFEIVYLTAYTAASLNGTITRGAEDATNWPPVPHAATTSTWSNNPTVANYGLFFGNQATNVVSASTTAYTLTAPSVAVIDDITLSGNCVITGWASPKQGDVKDIIIRQQSTGGTYTRTVAWTGSTFHCPGGVKPTMTTGLGAYDEYMVTYDGTNFNLITAGQAFS